MLASKHLGQSPSTAAARNVSAKPGMSWGGASFMPLQHIPAARELVLFESNLPTYGGDRADNALGVIRWRYARGTVTREDVPFGSLFERRGGQLRPRSTLRPTG